ncbi:HEAT repeat domain-containing protein [Tengunoibacter tsumagoiensis]|uniref:HEAT repeat domain-containing protein n=1 Tax=Tengunoibacter tsumagoiensis TaxID=2014871 RepID=A0A401ZY06_9CHLR|nr:hypothetical protein [Tengunoibacter tsumagoiensis]GCE11720.1 hypothetical protein KTT_15790 [Tengunoibacter tsumagoiensis]
MVDNRREYAFQQLTKYRAGQIETSQYAWMIDDWGKYNIVEALPEIEAFLQSSDVDVRIAALHTLTSYFRLQKYWPTARDFFLYGSDMSERSAGALALGRLQQNTQDRKTLGLLASVVADIYENDEIRKDAYQAMLLVGSGKWEMVHSRFYIDQDANWEYINTQHNPDLAREFITEAQQAFTQFQSGQLLTELDQYTFLMKCGRARLHEASETIETFLKNKSLLLQKTALRVLLLYLQIPNSWQFAVDALQQGAWVEGSDKSQHDPHSEYRQEAAFILGKLMRGTRDKKTLQILDAFFNDDNYDLSSDAQIASIEIYFGDYNREHSSVAAYGEIVAYIRSPHEDKNE